MLALPATSILKNLHYYKSILPGMANAYDATCGEGWRGLGLGVF
jgi:hypothetical protein